MRRRAGRDSRRRRSCGSCRLRGVRGRGPDRQDSPAAAAEGRPHSAGRTRSSRALMPTASETSATEVKRGRRRAIRQPNRRSCRTELIGRPRSTGPARRVLARSRRVGSDQSRPASAADTSGAPRGALIRRNVRQTLPPDRPEHHVTISGGDRSGDDPFGQPRWPCMRSLDRLADLSRARATSGPATARDRRNAVAPAGRIQKCRRDVRHAPASGPTSPTAASPSSPADRARCLARRPRPCRPVPVFNLEAESGRHTHPARHARSPGAPPARIRRGLRSGSFVLHRSSNQRTIAQTGEHPRAAKRRAARARGWGPRASKPSWPTLLSGVGPHPHASGRAALRRGCLRRLAHPAPSIPIYLSLEQLVHVGHRAGVARLAERVH